MLYYLVASLINLFFVKFKDEDNEGEIQFGGLPQRCVKLPELIDELIAGDQLALLTMDNLSQV